MQLACLDQDVLLSGHLSYFSTTNLMTYESCLYRFMYTVFIKHKC